MTIKIGHVNMNLYYFFEELNDVAQVIELSEENVSVSWHEIFLKKIIFTLHLIISVGFYGIQDIHMIRFEILYQVAIPKIPVI